MEFRKVAKAETETGQMCRKEYSDVSCMPASFKYRDVFLKGFPRHDSRDWFLRRHPPMPVSRWAKIYAPFDALRGFGEAITSKEEIFADRILLDDGQIRELERRLSILGEYAKSSRTNRENRLTAVVQSFVPCADPDRIECERKTGRYETCTGTLQYVDDIRKTITLQTEDGEAVICFEDILTIDTKPEGLFDQAEAQAFP